MIIACHSQSILCEYARLSNFPSSLFLFYEIKTVREGESGHVFDQFHNYIQTFSEIVE